MVLPVPESPKNSALTPLCPTFAEQCMGKTLRGGNRKFMMLKIDFFISPAYEVPPISTVRRVKFSRMKTSEATPSRFGIGLELRRGDDREFRMMMLEFLRGRTQKQLPHKQVVPGIFIHDANGQTVCGIGAAEEILHKKFAPAQVLHHPRVERVKLLRLKRLCSLRPRRQCGRWSSSLTMNLSLGDRPVRFV